MSRPLKKSYFDLYAGMTHMRFFQILKHMRMSSKKEQKSNVPSEVEASVYAFFCHSVVPSESGSPFERISDEVMLRILSFLTHPQLCMLASVSQRFNALALDPSLWKKIILEPREDGAPLSVETWRTIVSRCSQLESLLLTYQETCCGSGIRCLFDPRIRDQGGVKSQDL
jgi:hypothetical protein